MFQKRPTVDKKKLLSKVLDPKKDSLTRLKHLKVLAEHVDGSELGAIFEQHHPFFYSTFIDCFSNFDCASRDKQRTNTKNIREDLECILFALEKILVLTPDLIRRPLPGVSDSTKFGNLLQIFLTSSKLVFLVDTHNNATSLEDQVEMCKRIMNIYRFMVMKIFMNKRTWEQMLEVMMQITNHLFPREPPKRKEDTIGGRIAPAFFQTFIVSWIRANLYVHIGTPMWDKFQNIMSNLVRWRELLEEWSNTMDSLTRVLVKHVYDLNLGDLPLERPADRRRRNKAMKSFSTVETSSKDMIDGQAGAKAPTANKSEIQRLPQSKFLNYTSMRRASDSFLSKVSRSTSDGFLHLSRNKIYLSSPTSKDTYGLMVGDDDPHLTRQLRRFRSEYLSDNRDSYEDTMTNYKSRSPSPSRHFIDTASLKDSPLIIDSVSTNCSSYASASPAIGKRDTIGTSDKSVLVGGTVRGWTKDNAVIMWRRMLGLFGNINSIEDPTIHHVAMRCLVKILEDFIKVRENLGISQDNQSTPHIPTLVPPLNYFSAWLFQATYLPESFKSSKQLAYRLLCQASIRRHDFDLTNQYFACLYQSLHRGLTSHDQELKGVLIKHCNSLIYTSDLPGSSILAQDFIDAASFVLFSDRSEAPKLEAVQLLSCLMSLHRPFRKLMVLAPDPDSLSLVPCQDLKDKILSLLLSVNRLEDSHSARARIICALTAHIYQDLSDKSYDKDIIQAIDEVVASIKSKNKLIVRIGCDMVRSLCEHSNLLQANFPESVILLIETLCDSARHLIDIDICDKREIILSILSCLNDWCLSVDKSFLMQPSLRSRDCRSLLLIVLTTLDTMINDSTQHMKSSDHNDAASFTDPVDGYEGEGDGDTITRDNVNQVSNVKHDQRAAQDLSTTRLAAQFLLTRLLVHLGHFPLPGTGVTNLSCSVDEADYLASDQESIFCHSDNMNIFLLNEKHLVTLISYYKSDEETKTATDDRKLSCQIIIRDLSGKYAWQCSPFILNGCHQEKMKGEINLDVGLFRNVNPHKMRYDNDSDDDHEIPDENACARSTHVQSARSQRNSTACSSSLTLTRYDRREHVESILAHVNSAHPDESSLSGVDSNLSAANKRRSLAQSTSNPKCKIVQAEETMLALLTNQRFQELNHCERFIESDTTPVRYGYSYAHHVSNLSHSTHYDNIDNNDSGTPCQKHFDICRQFIEQLGWLDWDKRKHIDILAKNGRLLRELRHLDAQTGRETHKIAVIYVASGQEDKNSILTNSVGSKAFEEFVTGLGWEVDLSAHQGFRGGLQNNKSTGETSSYFCNSTTEVMYHVSTRIPIKKPPDEESLNRKLRHLGNDEIHIIWSEHHRDYRRGIIPTEFGDVIIAIYPVKNFAGFFRVQIMCKQDVPFFGPLINNSIVHHNSLAALVRATAINASRAKRYRLPLFQHHYEERSRCIENIIANHKKRLSFEEFVSRLYFPKSDAATSANI